ncbi:type II secretion system protein GspL [Thaumasiovibrio sp. DFM-14]|uniref:type II secretion system protein GspL n=1 Tax=Thaumasiovibrio sp. DFM-14 TaxID=3384792 RepID=UPI0039A1EB83
MSELLTIRLSNRSDAAVPWLVWSPQQQEVIASGRLPSMAALSELTQYAPQRQIVVLVDSAALLLTEITLPPGSGRQLAQVLPYLLEEELAQDVDELHVHLLSKRGEQGMVSVVEHHLMQQWLEALQTAGLHAHRFIPDCLCLPLHDAAMTAAELEGQWLLRQGVYSGAAVDVAWLKAWLPSDAQVHHFTPAPPEAMRHGEWQAQTPELIMQLLTLGAMQSGVNLLSGAYRRQPAWQKHLQPWRKVVLAAGLLLTVILADYGVTIYQNEQLAQQYQTQSETIFRRVFSNIQRIPNQSWMRRQMDNELTRLGGDGHRGGILPWLAELEPTLKQVPQISLTSLRFDNSRNELRLQAEASDFAPFERVRVLLSEQYEVEQGQLNRRDEKVQGMLTLRRKS